tara:strand:- start:1273 stop:2106 length:834 start_codon:yes stop_codon:yes gene_type:complete
MAVKFGGNFTNEDLKQAKEIVELVNKTSNPGIQNQILNRNRPEVETIARGMVAGYDPDFGEEMGTEVFSPQGIANVVPKVNMPYLGNQTDAYAANFRDTGPSLNPQGIASVAPVNPMAQERAADYMRALQMGQTEDYKDFFFDEASRDPSMLDPVRDFFGNLLGYDTDSMRGLYEMEQDKIAADDRYDVDQVMRKQDQDRELAAMLAAQQQQPVDPCPEGYRMDPVSKVCVPTDDTTEPTDPVKRTYDTMTKPEPNYTAATNFNVPAINLPDIFTGN